MSTTENNRELVLQTSFSFALDPKYISATHKKKKKKKTLIRYSEFQPVSIPSYVYMVGKDNGKELFFCF